MNGYIKKGHWYYKARNKAERVNISAVRLNEHFTQLLCGFEYRKEYKLKLKDALARKIKSELAGALQESSALKKRMSELKSQLERMEERFVPGQLDKVLYEKYAEV